MGVLKYRRRVKKPRSRIKQRNKFQIMFGAAEFVILGRAPFGSGAKRIVVNQNKAKGHIEDRRHILHYDEVLKPAIERVISNLFVSQGKDKAKVVLLVRQRLERRGIKRLPKSPDKLMERLVSEINSAPDNLIPDRADTNKAIEVVRGYVRRYILQLSTPEFSEDCVGSNTHRMDGYKRIARTMLVRDASGGEITAERNRMHGEILAFVDGCESPGQLWLLLHEIVHSVTFDFSPNITRDAAAKAIAWQKTMALNGDRPALEQLDDLLRLLD